MIWKLSYWNPREQRIRISWNLDFWEHLLRAMKSILRIKVCVWCLLREAFPHEIVSMVNERRAQSWFLPTFGLFVESAAVSARKLGCDTLWELLVYAKALHKIILRENFSLSLLSNSSARRPISLMTLSWIGESLSCAVRSVEMLQLLI